MARMRKFFKVTFTPVTLMMVPHARTKPMSLRIPLAGIVASLVLIVVGAVTLASVSVRTVEYYRMKGRLAHINGQFIEMRSTMLSLKLAEGEFRKLFSLKSKSDVLESADFSDTGSLDMAMIRQEIDGAMESVIDIKNFLAEQKDLYLATPAGWPVPGGRISSPYGRREHPKSGVPQFHSGLDISVDAGTEVKATADGIVSFAAWTPGGGHTVVLEHGHGFSTAYAHNRQTTVKVGQRVGRGDVVALAGSTGISTGPHVHYEVWKDGRHMNPKTFLKRS